MPAEFCGQRDGDGVCLLLKGHEHHDFRLPTGAGPTASLSLADHHERSVASGRETLAPSVSRSVPDVVSTSCCHAT